MVRPRALKRYESGARRDPVLVETFAAIARCQQGCTPQQVAKVTGLTTDLVERAVDKLMDRHYLRIAQGTPGQLPLRKTPVCVSDHQCVLGVRILPTKLIGIVTDLRCKLLPIERLPLERPVGDGGDEANLPTAESVVTGMARLVDDLTDLVPPDYESVLGLGVELGGHIDSLRGEVVYSPNLGWHDVALSDQLTRLTSLDVTIDNDVNAMAIAEHWFGDGRGAQSFAVLLLGDGIGCGLVINNDLYHGASGVAGEFGHLVVQPDGPACRCGNRGCLESIATYPAIVRAIGEATRADREPAPITIEQAIRLVRDGDPAARHAFRAAGEALGRAMSMLMNLVNPERIIIESQNPEVTELIWRSVQQTMRLYAFSSAVEDCRILRKKVAMELGAQGAAAVAISQFVDLRS